MTSNAILQPSPSDCAEHKGLHCSYEHPNCAHSHVVEEKINENYSKQPDIHKFDCKPAPQKVEPTKTYSQLKSRYTDYMYAIKLVCGEVGSFYKGKDCTCGNCKQFCKENPKYIDHIRDGLIANWGPSTNRADRRANLVQDILVGRRGFDAVKKKFNQNWFIYGHEVCYSFFLASRGYSHKFVSSFVKKMNRQHASLGSVMDYVENDGHSCRASVAPKKEHFVAWLNSFSERVGDFMPNEECIVLPYPKFEGVYLEYKQEMEKRDDNCLCHYSYACRIFGEEIPNIRLVRSKGSFVCCKICTSYQNRILKAKSQAEREQLKLLRLEHVEKQRTERIHYYSHREAAIASPDHILSIIMDGMDQSKTSVPLYSRRSSDRALGFRLIGVRVHGIGDYVFLLDSTVKGGANLMSEILRLTLLDLEKQNKLPTVNPILYLQLDNCSENKNKVLFGFLSDLVSRHMLEEVQVGFLMVGHTHKKI